MATELTPNEDNDQLGENAGDSALSKGATPTEHNKPDEKLVDTVVPDNDNGTPGAPAGEDSSNKEGGPSEENL